MEILNFDPFKQRGETINIGYQTDSGWQKIVFSGLEGSDNFIKITLNNKEFLPIPIPQNEIEITELLTLKPYIYTAQIVKKVKSDKYIKNSPLFYLNVNESITDENQTVEYIPPHLQFIFEQIDNLYKTINQAYKDGDLNGKEGFSPIVRFEPTENGYKIIITDKDGEKSAEILNGVGGSGTGDYEKLTNKPSLNGKEIVGKLTTADFGIQNGKDGISPTITFNPVKNGTEVTIIDKEGEKKFLVKNGKDGKTPIKGADYFTPQDKQEIENATANALKPLIPTKNSQLVNDSEFISKLENLMIIFKNRRVIYDGKTFQELNLSDFLEAETHVYDESFSLPVARQEGTNLLFAKGVGGGSYTLPVATQEKLGGVKVAPYDETFTQPVSLNPLTEMLMVKEQGGGGSGGEPWVNLFKGTVDVPSPITVLKQELSDKNEYKEYHILAYFYKSSLPESNPTIVTLRINKLNVGYFTPNFGQASGLGKMSNWVKWELNTNVPVPYFDYFYTNQNYIYQSINMRRQYNVGVRNGNKGQGLVLQFNAEYQGKIDIEVYGRGVDNE